MPNTMPSSEATPDSQSNQLSQFPPCRVCGALSSGLHYGANTCEACKVFFMRSLNHKREYTCYKNDLCRIKPNKRVCAFCRYKRCLSIGMSKHAIKIGRYTLYRHTLNQAELLEHSRSVEMDSNISSDDRYDVMATYLLGSSHAYDIFDTVTRDTRALHKQQLDYSEWHSACSKTIGNVTGLSDFEYEEFYKTTGLDIDNRHGIILTAATLMENGIGKQVKFSKTIPGFKKLSLADQVNIVRASVGDYSRLCAARCLNDDVGVGTVHSRVNFVIDDMTHVFDESYLRQSFALSRKLKKLRLMDEEIAVLKAICITFTDRVELEDKSAVDEIQWDLIGCLRWLLKRNHSYQEHVFYKIWNCILLLRDIADKFSHHMEILRTRLPDDTAAPLLREFTVC